MHNVRVDQITTKTNECIDNPQAATIEFNLAGEWRVLNDQKQFGGNVSFPQGELLLESDFPPFIIPSNAPTSTTLPSVTLIEDRVPAAGEGISRFTLSLSNSTKGSSGSTFSPTCFNHLDTVASVTDSPKDGTKI